MGSSAASAVAFASGVAFAVVDWAVLVEKGANDPGSSRKGKAEKREGLRQRGAIVLRRVGALGKARRYSGEWMRMMMRKRRIQRVIDC